MILCPVSEKHHVYINIYPIRLLGIIEEGEETLGRLSRSQTPS